MAGDSIPHGQTFSARVGLLYVFNLIVGTGALALPRAFQTAGYLLSVLLLLISAFTSYVCATFVLESMAIANCVLRKGSSQSGEVGSIEEDGPSSADGEMSEVRVGSVLDGPSQHRFSFSAFTATSSASAALFDVDGQQRQQHIIRPNDFEFSRRVEISEMAHLFLGRVGTLFTYALLAIYLFGDLAVYSTTVPKSLMNVICSSLNVSAALPGSIGDLPCHNHSPNSLDSFSRFGVYRICIFLFCIFCLPMILMGMARTKWLQLATVLSRWTAFSLMIVLATVQLVQSGPTGSPAMFDFHGFGSLFGVAVYAFMCHHSIPGLVTPIRDKSYLSTKLSSIYGLIFLFYCALSLTGSFAFERVQDIYTINFLHDDQKEGLPNVLMDYFLALFPVFVLSSSYVIVAITLCNNLRVLGTMLSTNFNHSHNADRERLVNENDSPAEENEALLGELTAQPSSHSPFFTSTRFELFRKFGIPLLVVAFPAIVSFFTDNVLLLASITGSFPGVGIQYVLPTFLILGARRALSSNLSPSALPSNLRSPFIHWLWPFAILGWTCFAVFVVAANIFRLG